MTNIQSIHIFLFALWIVSTIASMIWPYFMFNKVLHQYSLPSLSISPIRSQIRLIMQENGDDELKRKLRVRLRIMHAVDHLNILLFVFVLGFRYIVAYLFQ